MNVGEYGIALNVLVSYNIAGFTSLGMEFTRPNNTAFVAAKPQVSVGSAPLSTPFGTFAANQYASYTFADGDLTVPGIYSVRVTCTDATKHLVSDAVTFTINP